MKIAHISDIHVRSLSRFDEIKHAFNAIINKIKEENIDEVAIIGDIFHTKTSGITAEAVDIIAWIFLSLAETANVRIILGNHDLNLSNLSRKDIVSSIVNALNHPRIFLYRTSGTYNIKPGYNLCVFSLLDPEKWENVRAVPDEFNIACFHGTVVGSELDNGMQTYDGIDISMFENFDICLLGDLHKCQFLSEREYE